VGLLYLFTFYSTQNDSLWAGRSGNRIPVGAKFSAPVQSGPGAHLASHTMGTGSLLGVKRQRRGVDHPPPSSAEVKERVGPYLYSTSGSSWPVLGRNLPSPLSLLHPKHILCIFTFPPFLYVCPCYVFRDRRTLQDCSCFRQKLQLREALAGRGWLSIDFLSSTPYILEVAKSLLFSPFNNGFYMLCLCS
jgi:hypothetical protein